MSVLERALGALVMGDVLFHGFLTVLFARIGDLRAQWWPHIARFTPAMAYRSRDIE